MKAKTKQNKTKLKRLEIEETGDCHTVPELWETWNVFLAEWRIRLWCSSYSQCNKAILGGEDTQCFHK